MAPHAYVRRSGHPRERQLYGVSFNYNKVCACVHPETKDPVVYNETYLERFANWSAHGGASRIDVEGVAELLEESGARMPARPLAVPPARRETQATRQRAHSSCGCRPAHPLLQTPPADARLRSRGRAQTLWAYLHTLRCPRC